MVVILRARALAGVAALAMTTAAANAQTAPAAPAVPAAGSPAPPPADPEPVRQGDATSTTPDVVVTGSRIVRPDYAEPNPIVSLDAARLRESGNTNVTNFLLRVPALTSSLDSTRSAGYNAIARAPFGGVGLNELNLRGLGTNRTLVLVNGRRHVAGEASTAAVDINSIPTELIDRIDTLTGTTSAVYGADGVSGVVNFILKHDFDGLAARVQNGISEHGDAGNRYASVIAGRNFADGRANVTLAYQFDGADALANDDRAYLSPAQRRFLISNPAYAAGDLTAPQNILFGDLRYAGESPYGAIDLDGDGTPDLRGDGRPYDNGRQIGYYAIGGDSTPAAGFIGDLLPRLERHVVNLLAHYDASDAFKLSFEGKFAQSSARTEYSYTGNYPATLFADNPFIPASLRTALPAGTTSFTSVRDNFDFGRHGEDDRRRTWRGVIDATGRISPHAIYDVYYTYGQTDTRVTKLRDRFNDRFLASLDAVRDPRTGQIVCRSSIDPAAAAALNAVTFTPGPNSGCVPVNTFGIDTATPAALAFFQVNDVSYSRVTQSVANASLSGDFGQFFRLPGGAVGFAAGGEYRRETSRFDPNQYLQNNQFYQYDEPGLVQPVRGSFDVWELFGELNAPILSDVPFAQTLSVGAAGRYSHYSTIGGTRTWSFNGVYAPVRDVTFRGSYGNAVRAPNIAELFTPTAASQQFIVDPCDVTLLNAGTQYRAGNCRALLSGLGVNPATYTPVSGTSNSTGDGSAFGYFQGNTALRPETARTWTAGVVLRPRWVPRLTVSFDWYDIRLDGAISTPGAQTVTELCVDQPTLANVYCQAITRRQGTGRVTSFVVQPQNVSRYSTSGLDVNLSYRIVTARAGTVDLSFVGGYLNTLDVIATPGAVVEDRVNQASAGTETGPTPRFNFVLSPTWTLGRATLSYNLRWFDRTRRYPKITTDTNPNYAPADLLRYHALWQHDVQLGYRIDDRFALYGGVNNIADQKPDQDATNLPISPIGRFLYIGARVNFARGR